MNKNKIDNITINNKENFVLVSVNPKIFSLEVIYSAAYILIDKAYAVLDGNPKKKILITLRPKGKSSLEKIARDFNNELLNYAVYTSESKKTKKVREALVQKAFAVHSQACECASEDDDLFIKDPLGIAKPWSEKKSKD